MCARHADRYDGGGFLLGSMHAYDERISMSENDSKSVGQNVISLKKTARYAIRKFSFSFQNGCRLINAVWNNIFAAKGRKKFAKFSSSDVPLPSLSLFRLFS